MQLHRIQMFLCNPGGGFALEEAEEKRGPARVWGCFYTCALSQGSNALQLGNVSFHTQTVCVSVCIFSLLLSLECIWRQTD